ncbi:CDP-diacylglycerol pyrophosphatase family protein [Yersinia pseudotuberculosis]|uniref:CDP-diacylglycerol diphosphatase n=1 Tax=Yersinia pseudotuberculosis TaxID=633 RepID=UPI00017396CE|nr:CDP-diacylglycerol diphosphatase [Yersinia pseudotuberculosis]CQD56562.1 CDP-diacylglycerol pyrophosphatase [Yersinia intermedia]AJJ04890.1 CDP-diacylglycerol pyrophosphatase family protein [Yersinia pseudotuberculosis]AJJ68806.1 CDP-diacylglycerol pyrophosphatase family protein [Yersinia pseudotuberculosis PB1/+]AXY35280.1 CDP-diacylglycerol diphosphatase [Yersinia pseudotuberculosis]AYX10943.1 CDP-diacylglycerol diphosphatase [Yersinia pseudotuberculosis]
MIMKKSSVSRSIKWRRYLLTLLILIILAAGLIYKLRFSNADALWKIISQQCIPHMTTEDDPRPCAEVNIPAGFAVLKDRNGPLQYLLIPTVPISGIESPQLLTATSPNYFADAWQARYFMAEKYGAPIDDTDISLAINSQYGRTQDQLHIHISCLKPQVKTALAAHSADFQQQWQPLPGGLLGHDYWVRRITATELQQPGPFHLLADEMPGAKEQMGRYGLAITALPSGDFLLLADKANLMTQDRASAEELQDHTCQVLPHPPVQ